MSTASTVTGNASKTIERHLSSSYQVVLYVAKNMDKIDKAVNLMEYFDTFYLGAYSVPPTTTPSGAPLTAGMFYLNLANDRLYFWSQVDGVYQWFDLDTVLLNVIDEFDAHAATVTTTFTELAEGYNTSFLTYLNDTKQYRNETNLMYQEVILMHAAVINAYDQVLPVLEHITAIERVSSNITKVNTVADNIGSVNAVANDMPAVINAGLFVNEIRSAVASTHADAVATANDRATTEANAATTTANATVALNMRNEVEADRAEVAANTATVGTKATQVSADTALTQTNRNEAVAANALAKRWATGDTPTGGTPSDTNNAKYYSEVARANANQTFKSGGLFTPTAGQEYPNVTGVSVDTVWLIKFPDAADSYIYSTGVLAGEVARNGYQLYYDTPANTFGIIATTLSGVQKVNGKNPNALGEITISAVDLSDVYSTQEVDAALAQKAQDNSVVKLAGNQTIAGTKTFSSVTKGVKGVSDEDFTTKAQMDVRTAAMSQAQFEANREQNKEKYAASGWVHKGKHYADNISWVAINEGLWTNTVAPNNLQMGKASAPPPMGKSKSAVPVAHVAGVIFTLSEINSTTSNQNEIRFPQAPDGKTTYNKSTGVVTTHATVTAAFNAQAADPTNVEVVINRPDMWGFEAWLEEVSVTNPHIYPNGLPQSQATTMDGIPTSLSNRPVTYYAVFDGDTASKGKGLNFFTLTDAQKKKVLGNHKNNLYYLDDGRLVQWRLRQRTIAGAGNGDWLSVDSAKPDDLTFAPIAATKVKVQGMRDAQEDTFFVGNVADWNPKRDLLGLFTAISWQNQVDLGAGINGECYFLVCGTVNRLNQGAYHPSFNPSGTKLVDNIADDNHGFWYESTVNQLSSVLSTFTTASKVPNSGAVGGVSGRPDNRCYDAIYASGQGGVCRDMRYSAYGIDSINFAEADQRVKNGTYRGFEKPLFTRFYPNAFSGYFSAENEDNAAIKTGANGTGVNVPMYSNGLAFEDPIIMWNSVTNQMLYGVVSDVNGYVRVGLLPSNLGQVSHQLYLFRNSTDLWYFAKVTEQSNSVGGLFLQTDVIGNPTNILANPALANGWQGSWIGFSNELANIEVARKNRLSNCLIVYTRDKGASWLAQSNYLFDSTKNEIMYIVGGDTVLVHYQAFAKQTETTVNTAVYGGHAGVGDVHCTARADYGALAESLAGIVVKSSNTFDVYNYLKTGFYIDERSVGNATGKLNYGNYSPRHQPIDLLAPLNSSPAVKALNYNVNINQQGNIQYAYTQLKHNGTNWGDDGKVTIVDNQSTRPDLNGNTVVVGTARLREPIGWIKNKV